MNILIHRYKNISMYYNKRNDYFKEFFANVKM